MNQRQIARRLARIAELRQLRARREKDAASDAVAAHDARLTALDEELAAAEAAMLEDGQGPTAESVQLVELGREVHRAQRGVTRAQRREAEETLAEREEEHRVLLLEQQGKEKLRDHVRKAFRAEMDTKERKELDDIAGGRHEKNR